MSTNIDKLRARVEEVNKCSPYKNGFVTVLINDLFAALEKIVAKNNWTSVDIEPPVMISQATGKHIWFGLGEHYGGAVMPVKYVRGEGWLIAEFIYESPELAKKQGDMIINWQPFPEPLGVSA